MADEGDIAQAYYEEFNNRKMEEQKRAREAQLKNLPRCENFRDCKSKVFVTDKGTIARFCPACWEEFKEDQAA